MKRLAAIDRARAVPVLDRGQAQAPGCVWHPQDMETLSSVIVSYCRSCSRLLDFDSLRGIFANFGNISASRPAKRGPKECSRMADNATKKARTDVSPATCPQCKKLATLNSAAVLWQDQLWVVVHKKPPCGVVGHLQLLSKRHFRACHSFPIPLHNLLLSAFTAYSPPVCVLHAEGPSTMNDDEAAAVGPALRRCEFILEQVSGCDRVYTAALGSPKSGGHFHAHMMPIFDARPPKHVTGTPFDVFLQEKLAADGVEGAEADAGECAKLAAAFKERISADDGEAAAADGKGD